MYFCKTVAFAALILFFSTSCVLLSSGQILKNGDPVMTSANQVRRIFGGESEKEGPDRIRVNNHRDAFLEMYGLGEKIRIESFDGAQIAAYLYRNNSHMYYVCAHGVLDRKERAIECGSYMFDRGYNFLTYDLRAHGESSGAYIGCGENDAKDLICVVDYIVDMDPEAIIAVHGKSISGYAALATCGNGLSDHVKCIICDCGFVRASDVVENYAGSLPGFILEDFDKGVFRATGKHISEIDASQSLQNNTIPIYFIGAEKDQMVSADESETIKNLLNPSVPFKSMIVKGAGHLQPVYFGLDNYLGEIFGFCDCYMTVEKSPEKV